MPSKQTNHSHRNAKEGSEVWGDVKSKALKRHLKYCKDNVCQCLSTFFDKQNGGRSGLAERFERMMAPNAVKTGIPTHARQIEDRKKALREAQDLYESQGCHDPNAPQHSPISQEALSNAGRAVPTAQDWEDKHGRPMPEGDYQPGQKNQLQSQKYTGLSNTTPDSSMLDWEYWEEVTGLSGAALVVYLIFSEGSRAFPPRNLVPVP